MTVQQLPIEKWRNYFDDLSAQMKGDCRLNSLAIAVTQPPETGPERMLGFWTH